MGNLLFTVEWHEHIIIQGFSYSSNRCSHQGLQMRQINFNDNNAKSTTM